MPSISMEVKKNQMLHYQEQLLDRMNSIQSFMNRNIYRVYQKAQMMRWQTEGASEDIRWPEYASGANGTYARYKIKKFSGFPGGGKKMMVATGRLMGAATGQNPSGIVKIATNKSLIIKINESEIPYAKYPGAVRPYMCFGKKTIEEMRRNLSEYIRGLTP